jgi:Cdc6-like AAA superfamily ATPase
MQGIVSAAGGVLGLGMLTLPFIADAMDREDTHFVRDAFIRPQSSIVQRPPAFQFQHDDKNDKIRMIRKSITPALSKDRCGIDTSRFMVLSGPSGCGKTYFVKSLVRERQLRLQKGDVSDAGGMLYVSGGRSVSAFEEAFAECIGYKELFEPSAGRKILQLTGLLPSPGAYISSTSSLLFSALGEEVDGADKQISKRGHNMQVGSVFRACLPKFVGACKSYRSRSGVTPVVVIDNADFFCETEEGRQFLGQLRRLAKEWAVSSSNCGTLT